MMVPNLTLTASGEGGIPGPRGPAGADGKSAYEVAVAEGFIGDEAAWLASLVGPAGADGQDGQPGADGAPGTDGAPGQPGNDGLSAYEVAVANGFIGDEIAWLASLKGEKGDPGDGSGEGTQGPPGEDGKSAYEIALDNGFIGDETAWLASLVGPAGEPGSDGDDGQDGAPGTPGADGKSAYQIAVDNGFIGSEAEWIISIGGGDVYRSISASGNALASDSSKTLIADSSAAVVVTIPSGLNLGIGKVIGLLQKGTGVASFAAGSGVTLSVPATYKAACRFRYGIISAMHIGSNQYVVLGALGDA